MTSRPQLFIRDGGRIVAAPSADIAVAERYLEWPDKGPLRNGRRVTVMAAKTTYAIGEEVRIIHVLEVTEPGLPLYVMGPKQVLEEYVDGQLATDAVADGIDPLFPGVYDGAVIPGPGLDFNWEITEYRFTAPGRHGLMWRPDPLESNVLFFHVAEMSLRS